jgi:UDP-glucose 4-epimerase
MIVVTGGAGFIGTNLCKKLKELGYDVLSIDDYSSGKMKNHITDVKYVTSDCKNIDTVVSKFSKIKPEMVFHLGEYSKVTPSFKDTDKIINTNLYSTAKVIEYCKDNNIKLIYAGSSTKYANDGANQSPYAFSKAKNTELIKNYAKWFDLKYSICYFYNNYGPYQDTCNDGWETVISIFEKQKNKGIPLTIVKPGTQRRNFTYVGDTVDGLIAASRVVENGEYQLCSEESFNMFELAELFNHNFELIPERKGDRQHGIGSYEHTYDKLNWKANNKLKNWINRHEN